MRVSILILLEMSLEVLLFVVISYANIGFNPYFVGDESGRCRKISLKALTQKSFNPYFVGDESGSI